MLEKFIFRPFEPPAAIEELPSVIDVKVTSAVVLESSGETLTPSPIMELMPRLIELTASTCEADDRGNSSVLPMMCEAETDDGECSSGSRMTCETKVDDGECSSVSGMTCEAEVDDGECFSVSGTTEENESLPSWDSIMTASNESSSFISERSKPSLLNMDASLTPTPKRRRCSSEHSKSHSKKRQRIRKTDASSHSVKPDSVPERIPLFTYFDAIAQRLSQPPVESELSEESQAQWLMPQTNTAMAAKSSLEPVLSDCKSVTKPSSPIEGTTPIDDASSAIGATPSEPSTSSTPIERPDASSKKTAPSFSRAFRKMRSKKSSRCNSRFCHGMLCSDERQLKCRVCHLRFHPGCMGYLPMTTLHSFTCSACRRGAINSFCREHFLGAARRLRRCSDYVKMIVDGIMPSRRMKAYQRGGKKKFDLKYQSTLCFPEDTEEMINNLVKWISEWQGKTADCDLMRLCLDVVMPEASIKIIMDREGIHRDHAEYLYHRSCFVP